MHGGRLGRNYEVTGIVKFNAKFKDVVGDVERLASDFGKQDCVNVMGVGNAEEDEDFRKGFSEGMGKVISVQNESNYECLITEVWPNRTLK